MGTSGIRKPINLPTGATAAFIESYIEPGARIIEIGCGSGQLAAVLTMRGYDVTAIDSSREAIGRAYQYGIKAIHASWPDFECDPVDAVLFSRSLHHISDLQGAVRKAKDVLKPAGVLLVEDFAYDEIEPSAIEWFQNVLISHKGQSMIWSDTDQFIEKFLASEDPEKTWREHHDHGLHTAKAMQQAIEEIFNVQEVRRVPYLYRYLVPVLPADSYATSFIGETFMEESNFGDSGKFSLIGFRVVAEPARGPEQVTIPIDVNVSS